MTDVTTEIREKAHRVCSEYLGGVWKTIEQEDIIIHRFLGGFLNLTLKLSLPPHLKAIGNEPSQVVMKCALDMMEQGDFQRMTENIVVVLLAERNLAPKVYAVFDGGRLDEYIESRPLQANELQNPKILSAIARKIAKMHALTFPISKDPNKFLKNTQRLLDLALNDPRNLEDDPKRQDLLKKIMSLKPRDEMKWLINKVNSANSPIIYCHGDFQPNNLLLVENSPDDPVKIIDHDICGYNYRGHDFASLYNSFCVDFTCPDPPYFRCDWDQYPSLELQKVFIRSYLDEFKNQIDFMLDFEKEEKQLLEEYKIFTLVYLYFAISFCFGRVDISIAKVKMDWLCICDNIFNQYLAKRTEWFPKEK